MERDVVERDIIPIHETDLNIVSFYPDFLNSNSLIRFHNDSNHKRVVLHVRVSGETQSTQLTTKRLSIIFYM